MILLQYMPMSAFLVHSFAIPDFLAPAVVDTVRYIRSVIFVLTLLCVIDTNFLQTLGLGMPLARALLECSTREHGRTRIKPQQGVSRQQLKKPPNPNWKGNKETQ